MSVAPRRVVVWRGLRATTLDLCRFSPSSAGSGSFEGTVVGAWEGVPFSFAYTVRFDKQWRTRSVSVAAEMGTRRSDRSLRVDERGRWDDTREGFELGDLSRLVDVDLEPTPATNTLPIRRLGLSVGESADVTAVWIRVPSLAVEPLRQRYTRLGDVRYGYESLDSGFAADLQVDDDGLVVSYEGVFERIADDER